MFDFLIFDSDFLEKIIPILGGFLTDGIRTRHNNAVP